MRSSSNETMLFSMSVSNQEFIVLEVETTPLFLHSCARILSPFCFLHALPLMLDQPEFSLSKLGFFYILPQLLLFRTRMPLIFFYEIGSPKIYHEKN